MPSRRDEFLTDLAETIKSHGQCVISVFPDIEDGEPGFTYTVGLEADAGFEMVVLSLDPVTATLILNKIREEVLKGETVTCDGLPDARWCNAPVVFLEVDPAKVEELLCVACVHHHRVPRAVQLVWPDAAGFYPDDPRCDKRAVELQPLLGGRAQ